MEFYEIGLCAMLFLYWLGHVVYVNFWKPKRINNQQDYFTVAKIEKNIVTGSKYFFLFVDWLFLVIIYDSAFRYWKDADESGLWTIVFCVFFLVIWNLLMLLINKNNHKCLPLREILDVEMQIRSIESERFYPLKENVWHSKNWIRISHQFFPKSSIIYMDTSTGRNFYRTLDVCAVNGEKYCCNVDAVSFARNYTEYIDVIEENLPVRKIQEKHGFGPLGIALMFKRGGKIFEEYIEQHTTSEFIVGVEVLEMLATSVDVE